MHLPLICCLIRLGAWSPGRRDDRGDVPGWVLITVMSVGLVALIGAVAGDELIRLLRSALRSVN